MFPEKLKKEMASMLPKKVVSYQLHGIKHTRDANGFLVKQAPSVMYIPEEYDLIIDGEIHTIQNVIGTNKGVPVLERIKFTESADWTVMLDPTNALDLKKIQFLMFHPNNGESKYRNSDDTVLFKQINVELDDANEFDELEVSRVRLNKVDSMTDDTLRDIYRIYKGLNEDVDTLNSKQLKLRINKIIKSKPDLLDRLDSRETQMEINLSKAFDFNIIVFLNKKVCWGSGQTGYPIVDVPKGEKPLDTMKKFISLNKDGAIVYQRIIDEIKEIGKV